MTLKSNRRFKGYHTLGTSKVKLNLNTMRISGCGAGRGGAGRGGAGGIACRGGACCGNDLKRKTTYILYVIYMHIC